jgi:enamine deaminase RidA (YjgF/YER057c/UK114 family)
MLAKKHHRLLNPAGWPRPSGYSNGILAQGRLIFVAGQVGWDLSGQLVSDDLVEQIEQALANVAAVLTEAGAMPEHVVRLTWYVKDKNAYRARQEEIGEVYRELFADYYPAMTLVEVSDLYEDGALVEIEATAVLPEGSTAAGGRKWKFKGEQS